MYLKKIVKNFVVIKKRTTFATHFGKRMHNKGDSLAQQVEHNTFNVGVLGSSPRRITERRDLKKSLSFSKPLIAFDYQKVRNQNQVFHLECGTNKKREKVTPLDIKSHFRTVLVFHFSQMCYTMNNRFEQFSTDENKQVISLVQP